MDINLNKLMRIAFAIRLHLFIAVALFYGVESFSVGASSDLDYFKGDWTVTIKARPGALFHWRVQEDLKGGWMAGVVELGGEKVSTDFWRRAGGKIERFAFTSDGTFVRLESYGWKSNRLIFTGVASDKTGATKIRETITRINERTFQALWERRVEGKWVVFSDELCRRQ
jgi:hypothetical protein